MRSRPEDNDNEEVEGRKINWYLDKLRQMLQDAVEKAAKYQPMITAVRTGACKFKYHRD
jgi:hypothetical protein